MAVLSQYIPSKVFPKAEPISEPVLSQYLPSKVFPKPDPISEPVLSQYLPSKIFPKADLVSDPVYDSHTSHKNDILKDIIMYTVGIPNRCRYLHGLSWTLAIPRNFAFLIL
uniref:Uncharacterized protein n=1 Tax=Cacopsylla melanoneura TaxID=428564 RepID=A0A8D8RKN4_9HEMI